MDDKEIIKIFNEKRYANVVCLRLFHDIRKNKKRKIFTIITSLKKKINEKWNCCLENFPFHLTQHGKFVVVLPPFTNDTAQPLL